MMRSKRLNNLINTKNKSQLKLQLFFIFSVFCIAQLGTLNHQLLHIDNADEKQCLVCLSAPDILSETSIESVNELSIDNDSFDFNLIKSIKFHPIRFYSTRAPPFIT